MIAESENQQQIDPAVGQVRWPELNLFVRGDYDENLMMQRLRAVLPEHRVRFAAACAELLFVAYRRFAQAGSRGDERALRAALDQVWAASVGGGERAAIDEQREVAESLVPHDGDEGWDWLSALAEDAAAAVVYALRACLSGDARDAVRAAYRAYEAGDYIAQLGSSRYVEDLAHPAIVAVVREISAALAACDSVDPTQLRASAEEGGQRLIDLVADIE